MASGGTGAQGAAGSGSGDDHAVASGSSAAGGVAALDSYERLTSAALAYAAQVCSCFHLSGFDLDLASCAFADAHEYSGLRLEDSAARRCFNEDVVPRFPEPVACNIALVEYQRDCWAAASGPGCNPQVVSDRCTSPPPCHDLPGYATYLEEKRRCRDVLYCDDGQKAEGRRCNKLVDCADGSDEAACE